MKYMCFNETASITAFTIGSASLAYTIYKKMYAFSFLYVTIVLMQLVEYYAHHALNTQNAILNKYASMAGFVLLIVQPIIWGLYVSYVHTKDNNIQQVTLLAAILFILFGVFLFNLIEKTGNFQFTYLHKKCNTSICRLKWNFMSASIIGSIIFLVFYVFLFAYPYFQVLQNVMSDVTYFSVTFILLVLGILYMILSDKITNGKEMLSGFGSIWCFLCIFTGPLVIAFPKLAIT